MEWLSSEKAATENQLLHANNMLWPSPPSELLPVDVTVGKKQTHTGEHSGGKHALTDFRLPY